jgi:peptidoglycan/LPS O-acetylase OafA/YrhL
VRLVKQLEFLPRIESLRGIAALAVVGQHVTGQLSQLPADGRFDDFATRLIAACSNGAGAVVTFFVLSGFVLARSLAANPDPVRFFRNRLFRLFPAAIAVVALLTVLHWQFGFFVGRQASFEPLNVILNMLLIQNDINVVMWSMTVECAATPLILLSVWLFRSHGEAPLWGLAALLFALSFWGPYVYLLGGFTSLASFYAFVVGVLVHCRGHLLSPIGRRPLTAALLAIAVYCACGLRTQGALVLMLECLSAATVVALIVYRPAMALFAPLEFGLVRFYGRISYSLYLLHLLGISLAWRAIDPLALNARGMPLSLTIICTTLAAIVVTTPLAWLSWRFIETPAIRLGRTLDRQPRLLAAG